MDIHQFHTVGGIFRNKFGQLIDASFRPFFSTFNTDRQTDQQAYFPIEMHFYISVMFLGFPDEINEEKPSFLDSKNNWLRTDGRTDGRTRVITMDPVGLKLGVQNDSIN